MKLASQKLAYDAKVGDKEVKTKIWLNMLGYPNIGVQGVVQGGFT